LVGLFGNGIGERVCGVSSGGCSASGELLQDMLGITEFAGIILSSRASM